MSAAKDEPRHNMTHTSVTAWRSEEYSPYLSCRGVGTVEVALQDIQTILALLMQNATDREHDGDRVLSLHPVTVDGLLCAAESCAEILGRVVRGGDILSGDAFGRKTLEAAHMEKAWMAARHIRNQRAKG